MECETLVFCDLSKEDKEITKNHFFIKHHGLLGICIAERKALIFVDKIAKSRYRKKHGIIKALSGIVFHELLHLCDWKASEYEINKMEEIMFEI